MALDYVGSYNTAHGSDILHYGVKGMKWGVRHMYSSKHKVALTIKKGSTPPKVGDVISSSASKTGKLELGDVKKVTDTTFTSVGAPTKKSVTYKPQKVADLTTKTQKVFNTKTAKTLDVASDAAWVGGRLGNVFMSSLSDADENYLAHYGVKGMKWGVRRDNRLTARPSKGATPTRARKKEEKDVKRTKEVERLTNLHTRVQTGKATVSVNGKKLSTDQALAKIEKQIESNAKNNKVLARKLTDGELAGKSFVGADGRKIIVGKKVEPSILKKDVDASETSIAKYNRLREQAAKKGAQSLDDDDLKFLNTRREAIAKANAAYNSKDSKLKKLVKAAIEATLTKQLNTSVEQLSQLHLAPRLANAVNRTNRNPPTPTPTPVT